MTLTLGEEWHISKNGYDLLNRNPNINSQELLKLALDTDIKEICSPVLSTELSKEKTAKIVLQIQKIRNISAPKANEEAQTAPRMLKLSLTDGELYVQALELIPLNFINRDKTPPGTKILINNAKVLFGYLLLTPSNCSLLGGRVPFLIEKWEVAKSVMNNQRRISNEDGPPPWVNFGSKIQSNVEVNNFKSLEEKNREINKANSEFELQRQGAIAEATSGAVKKIFGGRVTQNIQANQNTQKFEKKGPTHNRTKPSHKVMEVEGKPDKPLEKVSLFSFLEDKLPVDRTSNNSTTSKESTLLYKTRGVQFDSEKKSQHKEPPARVQYPNERSDRNTNARGGYSKGVDKNTQQQYQYQKTFNNQKKYNNKKNANDLIDEPSLKPIPQHIKNTVVENNQHQESNITNGAASHSPINKVQKNIDNTTQLMTKMSLNSQFASRSLRQHLNLGLPKQNQTNNNLDESRNTWNIGDSCLAKYWEDGKFYNAKIVALTNKTVVVQFLGYGNVEEVISTDCIPASQRNRTQKPGSYSGSMEFRRSSNNYQ